MLSNACVGYTKNRFYLSYWSSYTISKGQYFSGFSQWENLRFAAESEKERDGYTANYVSPT